MLVLCQRYLPQPEEAREALMDGYLSVFRSLDRFEHRGAGSFRAWLSRIMVNSCLAKLRKTSLQWEPMGDQLPEVADPEAALARLSAKEILAQIQTLPAGYRMVFNLFVFEQLTHPEIARLLGVTESTSKTQLLKARRMLQEKLQTPSLSN
jgi:RNA polymerase sigma-70 factor (ECF subfamily)